MPKKSRKANKVKEKESSTIFDIHPHTRKAVIAIILLGLSVILILSAFNQAGPAGIFIYKALSKLFGWGYFLWPTTLFVAAGILLSAKELRPIPLTLLGGLLFIFSSLGLIDVTSPGHGGLVGALIGFIQVPFGYNASLVLLITFIAAALILSFNWQLKISWNIFKRKLDDEENLDEPEIKTMASLNANKKETEDEEEAEEKEEDSEPQIAQFKPSKKLSAKQKNSIPVDKNYAFPPLELLKSSTEKPTIGDLRSNANIIKRTLESFGMAVDMGEISIGPAVTRYTLKPAEGVKLSRITALNQDLALALAAHPIRIEAPIPGKSLVGIEVPNKAAALVRLGSLIGYPEFQNSGYLGFTLGRDVTGEPIFADIAKMPHLLIAGATGSGKSVTIHSLLISLLYKNSPASLRLVLIDPKRVELSAYENIPHLIAPVVTEGKKAVAAFRWAISEMDRRYEMLLAAGARDIKSYNGKNPEEPLPYILIVVDELADLMVAFGREIESSIVRLAQMARATGIHLLVSTQRPSVEVITGLIKANITARVALQVASQVDSRTILDSSGAEKLLGNGDLLFVSAELSKPKRIQAAYVSEDEVRKVTNFIKENNSAPEYDSENMETGGIENENKEVFDDYGADNEEDELFEEAVKTVVEAKKASASLLQRRLKVGYARAARLLDIMESKGIVGPGDGAKPREILIDYDNAG